MVMRYSCALESVVEVWPVETVVHKHTQ